MKIYIATPVNGRKEETLTEKRGKAYWRVCEIQYHLCKKVIGAEFAEYHSAFDLDIAPLTAEELDEAEIMGKCVQRVMECDGIVLDKNWEQSKGCKVEKFVAETYGKGVMYYEQL